MTSNSLPSSMIPISLYIHLPWCLKKCPYCDFNAHPFKGEVDFEAYVQRLITDLQTHRSVLENRPLTSIFIGGGTPSLFPAKTLEPLFKAIQQYQDLNIEITIEANPGTQDFEHYQAYRDLGINRISIGGQSFNPISLEHIGRFHSNDQVHEAIIKAKDSGFSRINLDIMYALPHQSTEMAIRDLEAFLQHDLEHLSWYQLNIEQNTLFYTKRPILPPETIIDTIDLKGSSLLKKSGYHQYEISAWTKGLPSQHNLNYWHFGDYIGIGAGAHSKITQTPFQIKRLIKNKHPKAYMQQLLQSDSIIQKEDILLELFIGWFRTKAPLDYKTFEERTQLPTSLLQQKLSKAEEMNLVSLTDTSIILTEKGFRHHNDILLLLS